MIVTVKLNLSKYDNKTILRLYRDGILTEKEVMAELVLRGLKDYEALMAVRAVG